MEKKLCKKCGKESHKYYHDKLCKECLQKRKGFIKKVLIGIGVVGVIGAVIAVLTSSKSRDDDDYDFDNDYIGGDNRSIEDSATAKQHPLLPIKAFDWIYVNWGEDAAQEVFDKVENGEMSVDQVETCISRADIDPKDWADFEDGWRPSGWYKDN